MAQLEEQHKRLGQPLLQECSIARSIRYNRIHKMIDPITGTLRFETPTALIAPSLTRDSFLGSELAAGATTNVQNEPYHSWNLAPTFWSRGIGFLVVVGFHHQHLSMVTLMDGDDRFGTSWADSSLEKEMARNASHEHWLALSLQLERSFPWGRVWCGYDDKGAFSSIDISYAAQAS